MRSRSVGLRREELLVQRRGTRSRVIVSWFSDAGVSSSRRAATISARHSSVPLLRPRAWARTSRPRATTGREHLDDAVAQRAAVALRDRIGVHELGGEAGDAERDAGRPHAGCWRRRPSPRGCRRRGRSTPRARDRAPPTARTAPKIRRASSWPLMTSTCDAGLRLDAVDELAAVRGAPDRAGRLGQDLVGAGGVGEQAEPADGGDGLVGGGRRDRRRGGSRRRRGGASPSPARAGRCARRRARRRRGGGTSSSRGPWPRRASTSRLRPTRARSPSQRVGTVGAVTEPRSRRRRGSGRWAPTSSVLAVGADGAAMATLGALAADAIEALEAQWSRFRPDERAVPAERRRAARRSWCRPRRSRLIDARGRRVARHRRSLRPDGARRARAAGYDRDFDAVARRRRGPGGRRRRPAPGLRRHRARPASCARCGCRPASRSTSAASARATPPTSSSRELLVAGDGVRGVLVNLGGDLRALRRRARSRTAGSSTVDDPLGTGAHRAARARRGRDRDEHAAAARRGRAAGRRCTTSSTRAPARPARVGLASVTVVAGEAWRAEVLAKAAFVAGPDEGARAHRPTPAPPGCS